jgi:C-terminal processing protease CtpA/Prc
MPLVFPKGPDAASLALLTPEARKETSWKVERDDKQADIAVVRFDSFIDASIVDEAMRDALALNPAALVIDLRSSWGVEVDALRAAQWVITEPVDAGAYVGGPRRTATDEPTRVTIAAPSDFAALKSTLNLQNAADITLLPNPDGQRFDGPVVVLISRRTSSTSEALTAALKRSGRVRVIGEATSGRPLLSREVDLVDGWVLRCAGFDLLAPKGAEAGLTDGRMMRSSWGGSREDPSPTARMVGVRTRGDREWQRSVTPHIAERRDARAAARREIEAIRRAAAR